MCFLTISIVSKQFCLEITTVAPLKLVLLMVIQFRITSRRSRPLSSRSPTGTFLVVLPSPGNQGLLQNLAYYSMKHKEVATKLWIVL